MRAEKVTSTLLSGAAAVTAIVGAKISAVEGLQPDDAPYLVYWKEGASRDKTISLGGPALVYATVSVQCVALDYPTLKALGEAVRATLVSQFGTIAGVVVNEISVAGEGPDFFDPDLSLYAQIWQFLITHQE